MGFNYFHYFLCVIPFIFLIWFTIRRVLYWKRYFKNIKSPKWRFPFGNTLDFVEGSTSIVKVLQSYFEKYGDTVLIHKGLFDESILTIDYDFVEFLLSTSDHITKADPYQFFHSWLGEGLLTSTGRKWRRHRKIITPSFHFNILQEFVHVFNYYGDQLINKLNKEDQKASIEVSGMCSLYALDVICETAMGVKVNALEQQTSIYIEKIKIMCNVIMNRIFSLLNSKLYFFTLTFYKEKIALKVIHNYVENVIKQRMIEKQLKANDGNVLEKSTEKSTLFCKKRLAFLDLLLESNIDGKSLSFREVRDEVNTFMFEGHDTTATAIAFSLYLIATHPLVQDKVLKEQKELFGSNFKKAHPNYIDLNKMKYLEVVIKETLRLYPPVPLIGRRLNNDVEFKGTIYPKGVNVSTLIYVYQRNPKYFEKPNDFIPERFQNPISKSPFSYIPFSAGPRNCIGQKFAMLEMLAIISKIVRHFEIKPPTPAHEMLLAAESILVSKNGIRIGLKNREHVEK